MSKNVSWEEFIESNITTDIEKEVFSKYLKLYKGDRYKAINCYAAGLHLDPCWQRYKEFKEMK